MHALVRRVTLLAACAMVGTADPALAQQSSPSASQPATPLPADLCSAPGQQCFKPSNTAPTGINDPPPPPRDLTLQYPGDKSLTDADVAAVAGTGDKLIRAGTPAVEAMGGKAVGAVAEGGGAVLSGFKAGVDAVNAAETGYSEGGVLGAVANVSKVGVTNLVETGAFDVTTALTFPVLGPLAPCAGLLVGCAAGAVADSVLDKPLSPPSDYGVECAKAGSCASGSAASGNSPPPALSDDDISQAVNAAVDATVATTDKQLDDTLTAAEIAQAKSGPTAAPAQSSSSDPTLTALSALQTLQNTLNSTHTAHMSSSNSGTTFLGCGPCAHAVGNSHQCEPIARGEDTLCDKITSQAPSSGSSPNCGARARWNGNSCVQYDCSQTGGWCGNLCCQSK
jgi:hypothetical protein